MAHSAEIYLRAAMCAPHGMNSQLSQRGTTSTPAEDHPYIALGFLVVAAVFFAALLSISNQTYHEKQYWQLIDTLNAQDVARVEIQRIDDHALLAPSVLTDSTVLNGFVMAIKGLQPYSPAHDLFADEWYLMLQMKDGRAFEFMIYTKASPDTRIYVVFGGDPAHPVLAYYGEAVSVDAQFRDWLVANTSLK